jgi:DNA-binding transcriptional LysR family regulator
MFQYGDMVDWLGRLDDRQELPRLVPRYKTEYLASLCAMVSARLAITVLPMMYTQLLSGRELIVRRLEAPRISRSIVVIRRRNPVGSEAVSACFSLLQEALQAYLPPLPQGGRRRRRT